MVWRAWRGSERATRANVRERGARGVPCKGWRPRAWGGGCENRCVVSDVRWFAILEPGEAPGEWQELARELEQLTGGVVDLVPHVTVGWGRGTAEPARVVEAFRDVALPPVRVRLRAPVDYQESERLHFRWVVGVAVEKDKALRAWHARSQAGLRTTGLEAPEGTEAWWPHVTVVRGEAGIPPPEETRRAAVALLEGRAEGLRLMGDTLRVTRLVDGSFERLFERGLGRGRDHGWESAEQARS